MKKYFVWAVLKTVSGMIKLLFPDPEMEITDKDMEAIIRMALEARRRVKGAFMGEV